MFYFTFLKKTIALRCMPHNGVFMALERQLTFFDDHEDDMRFEFQLMKNSNEKIRKSLFAKNNELKKEVKELNERLSLLECYIFKQGNDAFTKIYF